ncbi:MAG TPA: alpha/beta fold hydrolase [Kofleriaceae bacterium]|nr:alpha/beta fold hydrolase [Kofleriaceae bacterium]
MSKRLRNLLGLVGRKPAVGQTPADVMHRENKWRLLRYRGGGPRRGSPILLVPSLINRHYILDLQPGRSFAEWLLGQGHDVWIIDWGTPGPEDRWLTFDDVCDGYLGRAVRAVGRHGGGRAHLLGYCLGGTLAAIHTSAHPERVASLTCMAAPIDFHDDGLLSRWTRTRSFDVGALIDAFGNVPWPLMQASFHMLRPTMNLAKLVRLLDRAWDDEFLDSFLATETWGADNVSFPGECYRRYIEELYRDNALVAGRFTLSGRPAQLSAIDCPVQVVSFEHDHIVPAPSATALLDQVSSSRADHLHLQGGHIGAVVSRTAARTLWPALSRFWLELDGLTKPVHPERSRAEGPAKSKGTRA